MRKGRGDPVRAFGLRQGSTFGRRARCRPTAADAAVDALPPDPSCAGLRGCDVPGCAAEGAYRAPKARDRLREYYWFCLEHVRAYNQAWDYCAGMSASEIEMMIRGDQTWQRNSWPLGLWRVREHALRDAVLRDFGLGTAGGAAGAAAGRRDRGAAPGGPRPAPESAEARAMAELELEPPVSFAEIKARYRALVKRHHPDTHGGDKSAEERLKRINLAYTVLKECHGG